MAFIILARPIQFSKYHVTQWISKLAESFEIHWVRKYLVNVVLFGIKDLQTSEMAVKLKCNLYVRSKDIFLVFDTALQLPRWPRIIPAWCSRFWECPGDVATGKYNPTYCVRHVRACQNPGRQRGRKMWRSLHKDYSVVSRINICSSLHAGLLQGDISKPR